MPSANIFRQARGENRIFRNEAALLPDYLPGELPGREREISEIVFCLKPASENRQPEHALLVGPPGTGKTSSAKFVLKQLAEYSARPLPIYINCWENPSRLAIFLSISSALGEPMPRRGLASDEVFSRIVEIAKKEERIPVVVLDEADRLGTQKDGLNVLYDLCRAGESNSLPFGVIAITNDTEFGIRLDARVRSSFVQHTLSFNQYTVPQLKEILGQRAKLAFFEGALDSEVIPLCSAIAHKQNGDARVAFRLLHSAGKAAERENSPKVEVKHVRSTQSQALEISTVKAERKMDEMDPIDRAIVENVKAAGKNGIESGKLYSLLSKLAGTRALRARVDNLEQLGVLQTETLQLKMGRSRVIRIKE